MTGSPQVVPAAASSAFKLFDAEAWRRAEVVLAGLVVATVAVLVVPLPPVVLDLLVVLSLATALVVMMVSPSLMPTTLPVQD